MKRVLLASGVLAAGVFVFLQAYTGQLVTSGGTTQAVTWPGAVTYLVNDQTSATLGNMEAGSDPATAVDNAFASLAGASGMTLTNGGTSTITDAGADGTNLITFANTPTNVSVVGGAIAVTVLSYSTSTFTILEADMVFNPAFNFSTLGSASMYDVEAITTHEGGHLLGLDHSPICGATMFPYANTADSGPASLSSDDIAGLRSLYPPAGVHPPGSVAGFVLDGSAQPVFGAHVGMHDAITGRIVTGTVTLPDGSFQVDQVPPGVYHVIIEPMDGPMSDANLQGGTWSSASMNTSFKTTFHGGASDPTEVVVHAVESVALGNISVDTNAPSVNIAGIALTSSSTGFSGLSALPVSFQLPYTQYVVISGPGVDTAPDNEFSVHGGLMTLGTSTSTGVFGGGDGWKIFPLTAANNLPVGLYSLRWDDASSGDVSFYTGGLDAQAPATATGWVNSYGTACVGTSGTIALTANSDPVQGNGSFAVSISNVINSETVYWICSYYPEFDTSHPGCVLGIDTNWLATPWQSLSGTISGTTATLAGPVPVDASVPGRECYLQAMVTDPSAPAGVAGSNAIAIHYE